MKNSIANVWLLSIIITFILLFACYITITINYTASFKYKNEILNIIEKHHGMTNNATGTTMTSLINGQTVTGGVGSIQTITLYLKGNAYSATGYCPDDGAKWYGADELTWDGSFAGANIEEAASDKKYYYCFSKYGTGIASEYSTVYYKFRLFYKFEFPVLNDFFSIKVEGMTNEIYNPANDGFESNSDFFD